MQNFADNFYGVSEVNKNWGNKKPGQFNIGLIYARDDVMRTPELNGDSDPAYLFYTSLTQRFHKKFTPYIRYGLLNNTDSSGNDYNVNHITTGFISKLTDKDILTSHVAWFKSDVGPNQLIHLNFWIHKFNKHINSTLFYVWKYGTPNANTFDGDDNSWFIGTGLTATL